MANLPNLSDASDQELMARAREGDEAARCEIVRRLGPRVYDRTYRMVRHHEAAEDLTQETFVKMFCALERNGPERNPSAWIGRIADNTALVPALPGCISEGDSREEALANIEDAIQLYLEPVDDDALITRDVEVVEIAV